MKKTLFTLLVLIATVTANAAPKKAVSYTGSPQTIATLGTGLALIGPFAFWSINGTLVHNFIGEAPDLYFGGDVAVDIGISVNLELLPTAIYRFHLNSTNKWVPYAGMSIGPTIGFTSVGVGGAFTFVVRPGVEYLVNDNVRLAFEMKFGTMGGAFYFRPNVSWVFFL